MIPRHVDTDDPELVRTALGDRVGVRSRHKELIGLWQPKQEPPQTTIPDLPAWAQAHQVKAVVWTNLTHNFRGKNSERIATAEEIVAYLSDLEGDTRDRAERYIRSALQRIDTKIRQEMEAAFGWRAIGKDR